MRATVVRMVGLTGFEPVTLRLSSACSNQLSYRPASRAPAGGAGEIRTPDLLLAKQPLHQLSYSPGPGPSPCLGPVNEQAPLEN